MRKDHPPRPYKDPVCGMEVSHNTAPATAEFEGKTYYFCAGACRDAFVADPGKYVRMRNAPSDKESNPPDHT